MTDAKILEVIRLYEDILEEFTTCHCEDCEQKTHLYTMLAKMRVFLAEGRREKAFRWLGFVQGALWVLDIYSIDEMKEHNRE